MEFYGYLFQMLILRPLCEILLPFKFYLVCYYQNGKVKAPHNIKLIFSNYKKAIGGAGGHPMPHPHRNRIKTLDLCAVKAHYQIGSKLSVFDKFPKVRYNMIYLMRILPGWRRTYPFHEEGI